MTLPSMESLLPFRFVTKSGCWYWTGNKTKGGYGLINHNGVRLYVHRIVLR